MLTLTDLGLLLGYLQIPNADLSKVKADVAFAEMSLKQVLEDIEQFDGLWSLSPFTDAFQELQG